MKTIFGTVIMIWLFVAAFFTWWTDRNLDFWFSYFKDEPVNVHWVLSFLLTLVLGPVSLAANVIAEIAKFLI